MSPRRILFGRDGVYTPVELRSDRVAFALTRKRIHLLAVGMLLWAPARLVAHDIPASLVVHAFVRPQGERLHLLVRVPFGAMRDVERPVARRRAARSGSRGRW